MECSSNRNRPGSRNPGLWIAVFGPDGAGKSGVIERLREGLAGTYAVRHHIHLRPMIGRGVKPGMVVTNPHAKEPRGGLASAVKAVYLFLDHLLGYWLVIRPRLRAGHFVAFDRYFQDYLIDPRRYRLSQSGVAMARLCLRFVPQPNLCFVLDVPAKELQRRKPEVSFAESERQREEYRRVFSAMNNAVMVNGDRPVSEVTDEVRSRILQFLSQRDERLRDGDEGLAAMTVPEGAGGSSDS